MAVKFLKKITVKTLGLDSRVLDKIAEGLGSKSISIARMWGEVTGTKVGKSDLGEFMRYIGKFAGVNLTEEVPEEARAQELILPAIANNIVQSVYEAAIPKDGKENEIVSAMFALEITITENTSGKGGHRYIYGVKPLIKFESEDILTKMAKEFPPVGARKQIGSKK
jgi:hypothetical protein